MIHFIHALDKDNPGDWWSSPRHYFKDWKNASVSHVKDTTPQCNPDVLIYGGGDLLSTASKHSTWMRRNLDRYKPRVKIAWGLGVSEKCRDQELLKSFTLFGIRNHKNHPQYKNYFHVPCASCLHEEFSSIDLNPQRDVGIIHHKKAVMPQDSLLSTIIKRGETVDEIVQSPSTIQRTVQFIKSSKKIISNSFHGCYWALLCGVPLIAVDVHRYREKMSQIHPELVPMRTQETLDYFRDTRFLQYCKDQNIDFYSRIKYI